jgi:hypothetical protein
VTGENPYFDPSEQQIRLEAILAEHADPAGAIPAPAIPALTADLRQLLDITRRSGTTDGYEEALSQQ